MFDASESYATSDASWRSCDITGLCDGPFGKPPLSEREVSCIFGGVAACATGAAAAVSRQARTAARRRISGRTRPVPGKLRLVSGLDLHRPPEPEPGVAR